MNKKKLLCLITAGIFVLGACVIANAESESNLLLMIPSLIAAGSKSGEPDCNGVPDGTAVIDACGVCGGDGSSCGANIPTVTSPTGQVWMDRNLGASRVATSYDDDQAYGDLYQWGRGADGHEKRTSPISSTTSTTDVPGHGNFIINYNSPYDWRIPQNNSLWQGATATNNPCPTGFRLPTETELMTEWVSWGSGDSSTNAFASPLKLVVAGQRHYRDSVIRSAGDSGYYWSTTVSSGSSRLLLINGAGGGMITRARAHASSVRCIKD